MGREDLGGLARLEPIVLVERHAVDQPKELEDIQQVVDQRRGRRDHEKSAGLQMLVAALRHDGLAFPRDVLENRHHRDHVKMWLSFQRLGENAGNELGVRHRGTRREIGVDAHAITDELAELPEQSAIRASDIEQPRGLVDIGRCLRYPPAL